MLKGHVSSLIKGCKYYFIYVLWGQLLLIESFDWNGGQHSYVVSGQFLFFKTLHPVWQLVKTKKCSNAPTTRQVEKTDRNGSWMLRSRSVTVETPVFLLSIKKDVCKYLHSYLCVQVKQTWMSNKNSPGCLWAPCHLLHFILPDPNLNTAVPCRGQTKGVAWGQTATTCPPIDLRWDWPRGDKICALRWAGATRYVFKGHCCPALNPLSCPSITPIDADHVSVPPMVPLHSEALHAERQQCIRLVLFSLRFFSPD